MSAAVAIWLPARSETAPASTSSWGELIASRAAAWVAFSWNVVKAPLTGGDPERVTPPLFWFSSRMWRRAELTGKATGSLKSIRMVSLSGL